MELRLSFAFSPFRMKPRFVRGTTRDHEFRKAFIRASFYSFAFKTGETSCEKLGAVHLLLHGIWAFKVNTAGERTDLVFGESVPDSSSVERAAESLVLTEWKRVLSPTKTEAIASDARKQAARYTVGALGGLVELVRYRFIVLVSENTLTLPADHSENGVVYRHVNVAVDPKPPSKS
jgi:hypothetical protein